VGVLFGIGSAFAWGGADFFAALSARRAGEARTLLFVQLLGLVLAGAIVLWQQAPLPAPGAVPLMLFLGLLYGGATLLLYRAMAIGKVSVVSPLASAYAIVSSVLAWVSGSRPGVVVVLGVIALTAGVALLSQTPDKVEPQSAAPGSGDAAVGQKRAALRGIPEALGAAVLFGVYFWAVDVPARVMGPYWSLLITRVCTAAVAASLPGARRGRPFFPERRVLFFMLGAALLDNLAFVLFQHGIRVSKTEIVVPLSSEFAAVTVILGCVYMRERPSRVQWTGILVVLAGVFLVSR
jgi:drug/metabolite transporter (DMT)-like permease